MRVSIHDRDALLAVSPTALSAYARTIGWKRHDTYRVHSDIYIGEDLPEIIIPRTERLGDYASVVAELIEMFAQVGHQDETAVYRSLVTVDRDIVRMRVGEKQDGTVKLSRGMDLIEGAHDMLLAAACSLSAPKAVYRAGANRSATDLLDGIRLGQTDQGGFVVTLLTPIVPLPVPLLFPDQSDQDVPIERRLIVRLLEALIAVRLATEQAVSGDGRAFREAVERGVSANLCEALVRMIGSLSTLDIGVSWAQSRPITVSQNTVCFGGNDAPILREAARSFRQYEPRPDVRLHGYVRLLTRGESEEHGMIRLKTLIENKQQSVKAFLGRSDYEKAVQAHKDKALVILSGDLECVGQRWQLLNPNLDGVLHDTD